VAQSRAQTQHCNLCPAPGPWRNDQTGMTPVYMMPSLHIHKFLCCEKRQRRGEMLQPTQGFSCSSRSCGGKSSLSQWLLFGSDSTAPCSIWDSFFWQDSSPGQELMHLLCSSALPGHCPAQPWTFSLLSLAPTPIYNLLLSTFSISIIHPGHTCPIATTAHETVRCWGTKLPAGRMG